MKKEIMVILICLLLSIIALTSSGIKVENTSIHSSINSILYVGGDGPGNYSKIQDAINDAVDGDTVFVFDDNSPYYENVKVDKSINLKGEDKNTTIIDGSGSRDVIYVSANWVNISSFTIQNSGHDYDKDAGIDIRSQFCNFSCNIITNNRYGIYPLESSGNTISGNIIMNEHDDSIRLRKCSDNTITGNIISNNNDGITFSWGCDNNIITGNYINSNTGNAIRIADGSKFNTITGNTLSNNCYMDFGGGIYILLDSSSNTITGNSFFNDGLFISDSYDNNVENNMVNGKPLVYLEDESDKVIDYEVGQVILVNCDNITIENQNLSNTAVGIELWKTDNSMIRNNDCSNNSYGIYLWGSSSDTITSNNVSNNRIGIILGSSNFNTITDNTISNNSGEEFVGGILLGDSSKNNIITCNNICSNNWEGIFIKDFSRNNNIYHNNFINNERNAQDYCENVWDDGKYGNYWSDYKERYPFAIPKLLKPWMWNTPYNIPSLENKDMCPLVNQWPKLKPRTIQSNTPFNGSLLLRFFDMFPILQIILNLMR